MKIISKHTFVLGLLLANLYVFTPKTQAQGGLPLWTNQFNGSEESTSHIAVDGAGNVFITGRAVYNAANDLNQCITIAYSSAGIPLWTNYYGPRSHVDASG